MSIHHRKMRIYQSTWKFVQVYPIINYPIISLMSRHILSINNFYVLQSFMHSNFLTCLFFYEWTMHITPPGSGDWIVAHATNDLPSETLSRHKSSSQQETTDRGNNPNNPHSQPKKQQKIHWLALELRCDRIYHTLSKSIASYWEHCSQLSHTVLNTHLISTLGYDTY